MTDYLKQLDLPIDPILLTGAVVIVLVVILIRIFSRDKPQSASWLVLGVVGAAVMYAGYRYSDGGISRAGFGQLGDYFGGVLNPIVAGGALVLLFIAIQIQSRELAETRKALGNQVDLMRRQESQSFFFSLLGQRDRFILEYPRHPNDQIGSTGYTAFGVWIDVAFGQPQIRELKDGQTESDNIPREIDEWLTTYSIFEQHARIVKLILNQLEKSVHLDDDLVVVFEDILTGIIGIKERKMLFYVGFGDPELRGLLVEHGLMEDLNIEEVGGPFASDYYLLPLIG